MLKMNIRALAKHLNLSIGTVSRALNDRGEVSAETRRRVTETAAALGYTPNQSGRSLRRGRTGTVVFVLPLTTESGLYGDPFFMAVLEGVQRELEREQLDLIVLPIRRDQDELEFIRRHLGRGTADAWLLAEVKREDERIALLEARHAPFVTFGRSLTAGSHRWLDLDVETATRQAIRRFIDSGHRRIGLITPGRDVNFSDIVVRTYRQTLDEAGYVADSELVYRGDVDALASAVATRRLLALDRPPTAIFVMSENGPVGVYAGLRAHGLEPGRDVAIIGSRDTSACAALDPPLTCFSVNLPELGARLGRMLLDAIQNPAEPCGNGLLWPLRLIEKTSDRCAPDVSRPRPGRDGAGHDGE